MSIDVKKFYITTSIAYTNAPPHIGFALELVQADAVARWRGLRGDKRFFLTGTDEHGRKVAKAADESGKPPKAFVDEISTKFKELAKALDISNDDFIRTSDEKRHWPGAKKLWQALEAAGDLYRGVYKGLYCEGCEAFKKLSDLVGGKCPDHQREPSVIEEENWFFRLSKYGDEIARRIATDELRIIPETRKNEVLAFIERGLEDVSVSRPSKDIAWGVPVPGDDSQTMYVWVDALSNYITALGYGQPTTNNQQPTAFEEFWPADLHIIGKDILRFHAVIWPALLLSAKLPLPKAILVHGHILTRGQKMSKSLGNVIDPFAMVERFGAEAVRYFLVHDVPTTNDGDVTEERFSHVYHADLAHTLGNLVSRVVKLGEGCSLAPDAGPDIQELVRRIWQDYDTAFAQYELHAALEQPMVLARFANEFVERMKPWASKEARDAALPQLIFLLGHIAWMLTPFLPATSRKMFDQLGMDPGASASWEEKPITFRGGEPLFPRISPAP